MAFTVNSYPLSALSPVKFNYKYNSEEKLAGITNLYTGGFSYYSYDVFNNFKDAVLSKHNCLVLTDVKPLDTVFKTKSQHIAIGTIGGSMYLKTQQGKYVTLTKNNLYIGGTGRNLVLSVMPISENIVQLKSDSKTFLQFDESYPYTITLSQDVLGESEEYRRKFEIDYGNNQITFKANTAEGPRFLSANIVDKTVRAIGVELNEININCYRFIPEFVSEDSILHDFDPHMDEVKYYNELVSSVNRSNLVLKEVQERNTNLLVSCPTSDITNSDEVVVNIAAIKTNFSSSNTYSTLK
tara:strand:+ start:6004 stop:6894 length:891 start_codon:yes stop_codon:yes gene_type:complete